jgi:hypothetical protein
MTATAGHTNQNHSGPHQPATADAAHRPGLQPFCTIRNWSCCDAAAVSDEAAAVIKPPHHPTTPHTHTHKRPSPRHPISSTRTWVECLRRAHEVAVLIHQVPHSLLCRGHDGASRAARLMLLLLGVAAARCSCCCCRLLTLQLHQRTGHLL